MFQAFWEIDHEDWRYVGPFRDPIPRHIGFVRQPCIDIEKVAALWAEIETKVCPDDLSSIHRAKEHEGVLIWHLSPFWIKTDTHRSFCTLFMRMIVAYGRETIDQSIESYDLAKAIKPAIEWWLAGNTRPTYERLTVKGRYQLNDPFTGICNELFNRTSDELGAMLVKP